MPSDLTATAALACIILAAALTTPSFGAEDKPGRSWETPATSVATRAACARIEHPLVLGVARPHRRAAVGLLRDARVRMLDEKQAAELLDVHPPVSGPLAVRLIKDRVRHLAKQKRLELDQKIGSWSRADEEELDRLSKALEHGVFATMRPYLIRAIAKNEDTGMFEANWCGNDVQVVDGSLGGRVPPSHNVPVVVFLQSQPAHAFATWSMDE